MKFGEREAITLDGIDGPSPFRNLGQGGIPPGSVEAKRIVELVRVLTNSGRRDPTTSSGKRKRATAALN